MTYDEIRADACEKKIAILWRLVGALESHCKPEQYQELLKDALDETARVSKSESADVVALLSPKTGRTHD